MADQLLDGSNQFGRFRRNQTILADGVTTYGRWQPPSWLITPPPRDMIHQLVISNDLEGRPDRIAYQLYGSSLLEWVLLSFNHVREPFGWPKAGTTIYYPDESVVFPEL